MGYVIRLLSQAKIRLQVCNYIHLLKFRKLAEKSGVIWHKPETRRKLPCDHRIRQIGGLRYIMQVMVAKWICSIISHS